MPRVTLLRESIMIFDDAILKVKKKKANFRLNSFHRVYFGLACLKVTFSEGKYKVKTQLM